MHVEAYVYIEVLVCYVIYTYVCVYFTTKPVEKKTKLHMSNSDLIYIVTYIVYQRKGQCSSIVVFICTNEVYV